jgi:DNA helicase IV
VASLDDVDDLMRQQILRRLEADAAAVENEDDGEELQLWSRAFGHVVVDEAQDLSPMQLRMIGRRCPSGSMTIVGDLGQASGPWAPASWADVVVHLPAHRPPRQAELTVSYRTPTEVMDIAAGVLAVAAPELSPSRSVRRAGVEPVFTQVSGPVLAQAVVEAVGAERAAVPDGKVAVITAPSLVETLRSLLPESRMGPAMLDAPLAVVSVQQAKGLEFDSVIVVEPARIVAEHPHGGRALYLALTRTTRRLRVVSSEPLPAGLGPPAAREAPDPVL